jgi:hypothetical protein
VPNVDSTAAASPDTAADVAELGSQVDHTVSTPSASPVAAKPAAPGAVSTGPETPTTSQSQGNVFAAYPYIPASPAYSTRSSGTLVVDSAGRDGHSGNANGAAPNRCNVGSPGSTAPGWMTAVDAKVKRDLIAGNFAGAYGLPDPASSAPSVLIAVQSPTLPSAIEFVSARRAHAADTRRPESGDTSDAPQSSVTDTTPHGSRGPQGGVQSATGGGGAASPLVLMIAFARVDAPWLKFIARPTTHLVGAEAHRLERPG